MLVEYGISKQYKILVDGRSIILPSSESIYEIPDDIENLTIPTSVNIKKIYMENSKLVKLVCNNDDLEELIIINTPSIQYIHILNTPLGSNKEKLLNLVKMLPDRNDRAWGSIVISDSELRKEIEYEFIQKDWYFGSPMMYEPDKLNKIRQYQFVTMGILDIWESAEYGEGKIVAIADTGYSMKNREFNYNNCLGRYNFSFQKTTSSNPVAYPKSGTTWHGTAIASLMIGQGKEMWGAVPKAKYYLMKIGNSDSTSNTQIMIKACQKAEELGCDVLNVSYSASPTPLTESEKQVVDAFADSGSAYCQATGNNGSTRKIDLYPTSYKCAIGIAGNNANYGFYNGNNYFNGIDFLAPGVSVYVEQNEGKYGSVNGTSAACPLLASCYILAMILFEKKYGRKPSFNELVTYMSHRTIDAKRDVLLQGYGHFNFMAYNEDPKLPLYNIEVEVD